ncbi:SPOR domain-containing protein [Pontibacter sp. E15-1]|uniref:HU domain-containing protein n=1 Tax=Pontibacter sp. E15-1 TaxID=2919918 RepID=UPI001F4F6560|nr:SPOR domain-containing protein [Pontibacter sp. E15-1]MCJ8163696.1 SPOR domain-containing protein [Pontibacter sp. E15-1]
MVEKYIKSLLYDHDCVIIPDFGGLITRYVAARINPVKHSFAPPSKKVAFNEKLILNDGLLISTIAYHNGVSNEEAQQLVASFVLQAKARLQTENRLEMAGIGIFRYSPEHKIEFEYIEGDNLLDASFGLPELVARPIRIEEPAVLRTLIKERQQEHAAEKQPFRKRLKRAYNVAAGMALAGLTGAALYFLSLQADYNLSSLNPVTLFNYSHAASSTAATDRYAADYVPFTAEEQAEVYSTILSQSDAVTEAQEVWQTMPEVAAEETPAEAFSPETTAEGTEEVVKAEAPAKVEAKQPEAPVLTINGQTGRSYIIIGGYSTNQNAELKRDAVRKEGHASKVLVPGQNSKLYRVSVADFASADEAKAALSDFKKSFGETIWVLNY